MSGNRDKWSETIGWLDFRGCPFRVRLDGSVEEPRHRGDTSLAVTRVERGNRAQHFGLDVFVEMRICGRVLWQVEP